VARYGSDYEYVFEHSVGGAHLVAPALAIESVAAGGGSVCSFDERSRTLRVGPESAGSEPGPACYGAGGPLTVTDVNLLLGWLDPARFSIPINVGPARCRAEELREAVGRVTGRMMDEREMLLGLLDIADDRMAEAIRRISVRKGYEPSDHALVAFGGAGAQHACGVAKRLGMKTIVVPQQAGLLSAVGLGRAVIERFAERQVLRLLDELTGDDSELSRIVAELEEEAVADLVEHESVDRESVIIRRRLLNLRLIGQETSLTVEWDGSIRDGFKTSSTGFKTSSKGFITSDTDSTTSSTGFQPVRAQRSGAIRRPLIPLMKQTRSRQRRHGRDARATSVVDLFMERYRAMYGHEPGDREVELESVRVVASTGGCEEKNGTVLQPRFVDNIRLRRIDPGAPGEACPTGESFYNRDDLTCGDRLTGPAVVLEAHATTVVESGWSCEVDEVGALVLRMDEPVDADIDTDQVSVEKTDLDPVRLELFTHRLESIAAEMGEMLRRMALSTNVKERLDFSCAVLDTDGELVVNAPHIPVHLGALGLCVREVCAMRPIEVGEVIVTNHPAFGGSHLPDITLICPIDGDRRIGYVAARAHHAEIGGVSPGSMPPNATSLVEEGVIISPRSLVRDAAAKWDEIESLLSSGPYPSRAVSENIADLRAALAAVHHGVSAMGRFVDEHGFDAVVDSMQQLKAHAQRLAREALAQHPDGVYEAVETLDDGSALCVSIKITGDEAVFDFTGTAPTHQGNLNATPAIVQSVVMYLMRLLVDEPLPLNEGLLRPVHVVLPTGSILNPVFPDDPNKAPAVVGGNVETSQRLVDLLVKAFGLAACSQGTMNNVVFGNESFGYYETICGGAGAGPGFDGADAVHTHMTNTRMTDPEIIEQRYPVRVERFEIRHESGGTGQHVGGNGVVRELVFMEPVELSALTQHRVVEPFGVRGGGAGAVGQQWVVRHHDGTRIDLAGVDGCRMNVGDRFVIETPGGGGWGFSFHHNAEN